MSNFDLNQTPSQVAMELVGNTGLFASPLVASAQTLGRSTKWSARYVFNQLRNDDRADLLGTIVSLRGQENRLRVPVFDNPKRGAYGGTPLVDGGSQTGFVLNIKNASINVTNWIRKGDYISVEVGDEHELKMATLDANSDGGGFVAVTFVPRLRSSPADSATVRVEDGVLEKPEGIFLLQDPTAGWASRPGFPSKISSISLAMTEDVFATQASLILAQGVANIPAISAAGVALVSNTASGVASTPPVEAAGTATVI